LQASIISVKSRHIETETTLFFTLILYFCAAKVQQNAQKEKRKVKKLSIKENNFTFFTFLSSFFL